jgi:hypothetical protein
MNAVKYLCIPAKNIAKSIENPPETSAGFNGEASAPGRRLTRPVLLIAVSLAMNAHRTTEEDSTGNGRGSEK